MAQSLPESVINGWRSMLSLGSPSDENEQTPSSESFDLSPVDVVVSRVMLVKGRKLPPGVVDLIFDFAEYWAHSSNEVDFQAEHSSPLRVNGQSPSENKFLLRSFPVGLTGIQGQKALAEVLAYDLNEAKPQPLKKEHDASYFAKLADYPTPKLLHPVRKVVFSIRSKDQGWGGEAENRHTYNGAWTWFEAGLEKFDEEQICDPTCTYDVRFKSASSTASPLPVCALRPLYPSIIPQGADKFRYSHPLSHQEKWTIVRNKTAHRAWQDHVITWSWTDDVKPDTEDAVRMKTEEGRGEETGDGWFVRDLKMGDVVTVWAKARFGGGKYAVKPDEMRFFANVCRNPRFLLSTCLAHQNPSHFTRNLSTMLKSQGHQVDLSLPDGLTQDQLLGFKPFNNWLDTITNSLKLQADKDHPFNSDPYALRSVTIQSYDRFSKDRIGFIKLSAHVANDAGETLPAIALLRGPSVAILFMLIPDDAPTDSDERYVVLTVQPRIPAASLGFVELPAGMVDDSGDFKGVAAQEIQEELGVTIKEDDLTNLSELAAPADTGAEGLAQAVFPSAGGCDEHVTIFSYEQRVPRGQIEEWSGRMTGLRDHGEKITLKVVPMEKAWREGSRDAKCLAALALWRGVKEMKK
ncbi:hypothetical protein F53441_2129 [Fusarium austroafricanum]|uniref:Nudix hydrolase domain-containing protein n=1 Tax=Fusarium austroafricanum TaxID=2364996 RepID=A0A8H4KQJ9_9HYPO|nr:hypothetical protein F53441_2129 [Fusarium austroafricanum]